VSSVGERIKTRRLVLGWTQEQLCTRAGLSKSFLSELESVSAKNLLNLASTLSVSLDYLMTGKASEDPPSEVPIPASLAKFAAEKRLPFRHTLMFIDMMLLDM
jgi:transcriptional regulator with XRE-family HTH domain